MENLLRSYTSLILRNFEVQELKSFLPDYISEFSKKLRAVETPGTSWEKIAQVLNANMEENQESNELIDAILFEKLFFNQDHVHIYHLESEIDADEFISRFEEEPQLNRPVNATVESDEKFISVRKEGNKVLILYRYESIKLGSSGQKAIFYVPCLLDFDKSLLQIRLRKHYAAASSTKHGEILSRMKEFINSLDGDVCSIL